MKKIFVPGKMIISGEHAVVQGYPGLVASLPFGMTFEYLHTPNTHTHRTHASLSESSDNIFPLKKDSYANHIIEYVSQKWNIDISPDAIRVVNHLHKGMGRSAALAVGLIRVISERHAISLSNQEIAAIAQDLEHFAHGKSSGLDPVAVVYGGVQLVSFENKKVLNTHVVLNRPVKCMLLYSGPIVETTKQLVTYVLETKKSADILAQIGVVTKELSFLLQSNSDTRDVEIRKVIAKNQNLLEKLGVVGEKTKSMIRKIEKIGGVAKISGAGGVIDGAGWVLCMHQNIDQLTNVARANDWRYKEVIFESVTNKYLEGKP